MLTAPRSDPAERRGGEFAHKSREVLAALIGCLWLAELPEIGDERRRHFATEARLQAARLTALANGHLLLVVSRTRADLYERLRRVFADDPTAQVVIDRRQQDEGGRAVLLERRCHAINDELRGAGVAVGRPRL